MKSVLMIAQNFYPEIGSAGNRMKNVYLHLKRAGYEVKVITLNPSYPEQSLYEDSHFWDDERVDEDVIRIQTDKVKRYTNSMWRRLFHYLEAMWLFIYTIICLEKKYDYVFVTTPPIFPTLAAVLAKKKMKAKLITDVRDLWPESLIGVGVFNNRWILKTAFFLEKKLYEKSDRIIINSPGFKEYILTRGVKEENIRFIPNSLTAEELSLKDLLPPESAKRIKVVYTGNIGLAQDLMKLIDVAEKLKDHKKIEFSIIGYGYRKCELEDLIASRGLRNIKLIHAMNRKATLHEVSSSHIAYVSLVEKDVFNKVLPGKIIDYMCVGKPVVADVSGRAKEVILEAGCGLVAETRSVEEISRHILKMASDKEMRKEMGEKGHKYAKQHFLWSENIKGLIKTIEA
ncbi:glycosyltransferase family 4 protein [Bacillus massiliglaciei]|uniref:glycosyltransferase family 4 protein n=1 Tax=Bacillus massiliglaciei TaxID=1816693 RepID=UPI000A7829C7|nr:glycosyltransferase family 4 protein [Bacillus massiliglaciei]